MRKRSMNPIFIFLACLLLVFAAACGEEDTKDNNANQVRENQNQGPGANQNQTPGANQNQTPGANQNQTPGANQNQTPGANQNQDPNACQPANPPLAGPCDPACQTGCAAGETCIIDPSNNTTACDPAGAGTQGDECGQTACAPGYGCYVLEQGATTGVCHKFCRTSSQDEPQCDAGDTCASFPTSTSMGICISPAGDSCTEFPNDSCGEGENCLPSAAGLSCVPFDTTKNPGDSCSDRGICNDGQLCAGPSQAQSTCMVLCNPTSQEASCEEGEACFGIEGQAPTFGVCAPAQG